MIHYIEPSWIFIIVIDIKVLHVMYNHIPCCIEPSFYRALWEILEREEQQERRGSRYVSQKKLHNI